MQMKLPESELLSIALNAMPHPVLLVTGDVELLWANESGLDFLATDLDDDLLKKGGEILHCVNSTRHPEGCGKSPECQSCPIRSGTQKAMNGGITSRQQIQLETSSPSGVNKSPFLLTIHPFGYNGRSVALVIMEDIVELHTLRQLVPICAHCKNIRCPDDSWESVETHMTRHASMKFTHGLCPECLQEHYGEFLDNSIEPAPERF